MMPIPSLIDDNRGAAFAEALVVLPVFAAALAGIIALNNIYGAKLEAMARARRLAWLQADSGECPPRSCDGDCQRVSLEVESSGLGDAISIVEESRHADSLLRDAAEYFVGRATVGVGTAWAPMPGHFGGGGTEQLGRIPLLCNARGRPSDGRGSILDRACASDLGSVPYAQEVCR